MSDSELVLLSDLIKQPNKIFDVDEIVLQKDYFQKSIHRCIYSAIKAISSELTGTQGVLPLDKILIEHKVSNLFPAVYRNNKEELAETLKTIERIQPTNVEHHTKLIVANYIKKNAQEKIRDIDRKISTLDDGFVIVDHLEREVLDFTNRLVNVNDIENITVEIDEVISDKIKLAQEGSKSVGISTGYPLYDKAIGRGMREGTTHVLIGRAGFGKSYLGMNMALNIATQNIPTLYLDTELSRKYQLERLICISSEVPLEDFETGAFTTNQQQVDEVAKTKDFLKTIPLDFVDICGWNIEKQISLIRRWFIKKVGRNDEGKFNKATVILDYLKLMNESDRGGGSKEYEALGYRMSLLHDIINQHNATMIMFCQQNRDGENKDDITTISGSDRISWFADSVTSMSGKDALELSQARVAAQQAGRSSKVSNIKWRVLKSRYGPGTQGRYIGLYSDLKDITVKACGRITEVAMESPVVK